MPICLACPSVSSRRPDRPRQIERRRRPAGRAGWRRISGPRVSSSRCGWRSGELGTREGRSGHERPRVTRPGGWSCGKSSSAVGTRLRRARPRRLPEDGVSELWPPTGIALVGATDRGKWGAVNRGWVIGQPDSEAAILSICNRESAPRCGGGASEAPDTEGPWVRRGLTLRRHCGSPRRETRSVGRAAPVLRSYRRNRQELLQFWGFAIVRESPRAGTHEGDVP